MEHIGNLQVDFGQRLIVQDGQVKRIGARAFDILELLVQAKGALVTKDEIMRVVWPRVIVEENNVQVQVTALRRLLGQQRDLLKTEAGRGYRLVSVIHAVERNADTGEFFYPEHDRLYGRDDVLEALRGCLSDCPIVTLTGPGGIGKTRLALEVARTSVEQFQGGAIFVDLSSVTDEKFTVDAVASAAAAAGLRKCAPATSPALLAEVLRGERRLIVLDNCEHVLNEAAKIATTVNDVGCSVLATSREPLHIRKERVFFVPPLPVPAKESTVEEMIRSNVVQFFTARTQAVQPEFEVTEANVTGICQICRALDGLPLAIELAAARVAVLGIDVLADNLDDRLRLLTGGHRASLPRHQTMRATLDWSYRLLDDAERALFRRLGVFVGPFSYDAARYVMNRCTTSDPAVLDAFHGLISKSLVSGAMDRDGGRFRLLETTRQYALMQLDANGERAIASRAHAAYLIQLFNRERNCWADRSDKQHLELFSTELDNIRAALDWALTDDADPEAGLALAAVTLPYLFELSLVGECRDRAETVLRACGALQLTARASAMLLSVRAALGSSLVYTEGPVARTMEVWGTVYHEAAKIQDVRLQARSLWGIWNAHQYGGEPQEALSAAERFYDLAHENNDATQTLLGMRIRAISLHYLGEQELARTTLESMLRQYNPAIHRWDSIGFRIDHGIVAWATLARILWTIGEEKRAQQMARDTLRSAIAYGNEMVLCYVLVEATIPICLFDPCSTDSYESLDLLESTSRHMSFRIWSVACEAFNCCKRATDTPSAGNLIAAELSLTRLVEVGFLAPWSFLAGKLALAYLACGDESKADEYITHAVARCEATGERWFYPELCRIKARTQIARYPGRALVWLAKGWDAARAQRAQRMEDSLRDEIVRLMRMEDRRGKTPMVDSNHALPGDAAFSPVSVILLNGEPPLLRSDSAE